MMSTVFSCEHEPLSDPIIDEEEANFGKLEVEFDMRHSWIPPHRIVRVGLHLAETAQLLYQGDYFQSANLTDNRQFYTFTLSPGTYYYEAIIACLCEGDSCSAGGFPGYQYAQKHIMGKFDIIDDETTTIKTSFQ